MKYTIHIDHELKLIRYTHSGFINAEHIDAAWEELLALKEFTQLNYGLLSDYRGGKFQIDLEFLPELMEFMHTIENVVKGKKQALIVDEPFSVAVSMIFKNEVQSEIGFDIEIFSTEAPALFWLSH